MTPSRQTQPSFFLLASFVIFLFAVAQAQPPRILRVQPASGPFATPLTDAVIDNAACAEWYGGAEHPFADPSAARKFIWTQTSASAGGSLPFGAPTVPGPRYLRLGFKTPVPVGSILVRGGDQLSVLRAGAPYPGNLADDAQWIPATRLSNGNPSTAGSNASVVDIAQYALWVLPTGTTTRALRFTHFAQPSDTSYAGQFGGLYLFTPRLTNLAPQATVVTSANEAMAPRLVDGRANEWIAWDNGPEFRHPVSSASPEWIMLAWQVPVSLNGLAALWTGFDAADGQYFDGPANVTPSAAPESDWHPIGQPLVTRSQYPRTLGVDFIDFGRTVTTRAVRLRITQVSDETHPHIIGKTKNGTRIWLGELMALAPLDSGEMKATLASPASPLHNPPIPIHFTLAAPAYVTLAIDDAQGNRVRNLIADTWFDKGNNTVWWDGSDDLERNRDAANHGIDLIPTHLVAPATYHVSGLSHGAVDLHYEMTVYRAGNPPWDTADKTGAWLTDHSPPHSTLFVPADKAPGGKPLVYIGSFISEGGSGLAWVDLDGNKQGGRGWIGGAWTAAPYLASDSGTRADPTVFAYVGSVMGDWGNGKGRSTTSAVVHLTGLTAHADKPIVNYNYDAGTHLQVQNGNPNWMEHMGGLAVHDGLAFLSLPLENQLLVVDALLNKTLGTIAMQSPQGLAFDPQGRLLVLSGKRLLRYSLPADKTSLHLDAFPKPEVLIGQGLQDPVGITCDSAGTLYISDRGDSNQVRIFDASGKFLHAIGHPGSLRLGPYDPQHMTHPRGLTIDSNNHLWVAEEDFQPKRVSEWSLDGKLLKTFYGPSEYGGGGSLDPTDKTRFYYHGMEFHLDWTTGKDTLASILYRPVPDSIPHTLYGDPSTVLYSNGHRYFINSYLGHGTNGVSIGVLYLDKGGVLQPVAAFGKANDWPIFQTAPFKALVPPGADLSVKFQPKDITMFTWSDLNENGKVDPEEVSFLRSSTGSITIMPDTAAPGRPAAGPVMLNAYVDGKAMLYAPVKMTPSGIPVYDLNQGTALVQGAQLPTSDGGGQVIESPEETVLTTAPAPFAREGVGGVDKQNHRWSYPSLWPGLHPSHSAPLADHPGELLGTTHLLGPFIHPTGSNAGPLWAINSNFGGIYLFTADGLFVTQLFPDGRTGKPWSMPHAVRDMLLNDVGDGAENFSPSLTQTSDGKVYVLDGAHTSIVRVDGLNSVQRLPGSTVTVTNADLQKAANYFKESEATRQQVIGSKSFAVGIHPGPGLPLDQVVAMLDKGSWATVDSRTLSVGWGSKPDLVEAAVTVVGDRLVAAYRTSDPNLLVNSGAVTNGPFKSGGALDLMIGTNPSADPKRLLPTAGDVRLLVYQVQGKTRATLFRAVVPGTANPVPFTSPVKTITLDQVQDVSDQVQLLSNSGNYAFSIPLATLGLKPVAGANIKADIGILRGNGLQTVQRVYWNNKATGITSDVPSEAELTPNLWGNWAFRSDQ